ncbi:ABC transporter ATP-binding protein [Alkalibacter rhizosphaerae]|uniref:ABC transporter ATP-binding protein n=1 Tax=Alkalibacter rhizosphaerae TaxID=2815577 RepID=A0A974XGG2_9FIRM|nr:ABC transporter ATP-binding protein [Alkalibacter rhizosphaerae]QSX09326.1 ABC transporter ATP-binding protein [Alkalibacter rhizosphaerae]
MPIILENVTKTYQTGEVQTLALKGIDLIIEDGEFLVILGPSGSGKSTLLNVISGLDTPSSGVIRFNDQVLTDYKEEALTAFRRENLGFVFQQYNLLQNLTAYENVQMGAAIGKEPLDVEEVLEKVGLQEQMHKYPYQLSGGEQQRVSVARSIAKNPAILFCDEPTGSLDEETAKQVLAVLEQLNRSLGTTMVVITHNPGIGDMADRVIKMNSGIIENTEIHDSKKSAKEIGWG